MVGVNEIVSTLRKLAMGNVDVCLQKLEFKSIQKQTMMDVFFNAGSEIFVCSRSKNTEYCV